MTFRVLVTGSRGWTDWNVLCDALNQAEADAGELITIVHGGCPSGADAMADDWGRIAVRAIERYPAQWSTLGRRAGFVRNAEMVASGPDRCLAFILGGSPGATHCVGLAREAGIPTKVWEQP